MEITAIASKINAIIINTMMIFFFISDIAVPSLNSTLSVPARQATETTLPSPMQSRRAAAAFPIPIWNSAILDANSSYDFQIYIRDQLNTLSGVNLYFTVPQGTPLVALRKKKICINTPTPDAALNRALKQGAAVLAKEARHVVGCHFHRPYAAHADGSRMLRADSAAVRECFCRHKPRRYSHRSAPAGSVHFKPLARDS